MIAMFPKIRQLNNGILSSQKAMPFKDENVNGDSNFTLARHEYDKTIKQDKPFTLEQLHKKKFMGNRDSSAVTASRRVSNIGRNTTNFEKLPLQLSAKETTNTVNDALTRVRGGGYVVPKKVTQKHLANSTN